MEQIFKDYEQEIITKSVWGFNPSYEEKFKTDLNQEAFKLLATRVIKQIGWDLRLHEEQTLVAQRLETDVLTIRPTEVIKISYHDGVVTVKSTSLRLEWWDGGTNSKRVKLFVYAFQYYYQQFKQETQTEEQSQEEQIRNWQGAIVSEPFPLPPSTQTFNTKFFFIGSIVCALVGGLLYGILKLQIPGSSILIDILIGVGLSWLIKPILKFSKYTNRTGVQSMCFAMISIIFLTGVATQYQIAVYLQKIEPIGIFQYFKTMPDRVRVFQNLDHSFTRIIIAWFLHPAFIALYLYPRTMKEWRNYTIEQLPRPVLDFVYSLFSQGHNEEAIREELSKKGWSNPTTQKEIFTAVKNMKNLIE